MIERRRAMSAPPLDTILTINEVALTDAIPNTTMDMEQMSHYDRSV